VAFAGVCEKRQRFVLQIDFSPPQLKDGTDSLARLKLRHELGRPVPGGWQTSNTAATVASRFDQLSQIVSVERSRSRLWDRRGAVIGKLDVGAV